MAGLDDDLARLKHADSAVRARTALRLGRRRLGQAVEPLLAAAATAVDDVCSIMDSLGAIGDVRAVPYLRQQAARSLLSRRRSAVEALRRIGDTESVADVDKKSLERLPAPIADAVRNGSLQNLQTAAVEFLMKEPKQAGLLWDGLYEQASDVALEFVRAGLKDGPFAVPFVWRYVK
ncbi:MAG: HEAT repeat domain-containing protein, partial [Planctomycetia bacterium]